MAGVKYCSSICSGFSRHASLDHSPLWMFELITYMQWNLRCVLTSFARARAFWRLLMTFCVELPPKRESSAFIYFTANVCSFWSQRTFANSWCTLKSEFLSSFSAETTEFNAVCGWFASLEASDNWSRHSLSSWKSVLVRSDCKSPIWILCSLIRAERNRDIRVSSTLLRSSNLPIISQRYIRHCKESSLPKRRRRVKFLPTLLINIDIARNKIVLNCFFFPFSYLG